jgi:hypothetical protein
MKDPIQTNERGEVDNYQIEQTVSKQCNFTFKENNMWIDPSLIHTHNLQTLHDSVEKNYNR